MPKKQDMVFVQTVREKIVGFYKKEIGAAKTARESQGFIGHTSEIYFKFMVSNNMIKKCPITASDTTYSHTTFFPNLSGTRGKTV